MPILMIIFNFFQKEKKINAFRCYGAVRLSLCLCFGSADFKNTGDFPLFFFYSKKHDTVTINNHAFFYTADACFREQGKKISLNPNGETEMQQALFYACNRAILYIMRKTGEEGARFCLFLRKYSIQPSMVHSSDKKALY